MLDVGLQPEIYIRFGIALALGLLIGIERGWSQRLSEEGERIAGIRTFSLIALLGSFWGFISGLVGDIILGFALLGFIALLITGYIYNVREKHDIGLTTEIAAFLTFALGITIIKGYILLSVATGIVMLVLLSKKRLLHKWLNIIEPEELNAGIIFLLISAVILPMLPNRGYGPWNVLNPYEIWWMVVLIAGLSFVGYIGLRALGEKYGILVTSLSGGLVSSTAVTITMGGFTRTSSLVPMLTEGVLVASVASFMRILIWVGIFNRALFYEVWIPVVMMIFATIAGAVWIWQTKEIEEQETEFNVSNPLQLSTAIKFGLILAVVFILVEVTRQWFGEMGVYILSFISGLADVDSITLSLAKMTGQTLAEDVARTSIVIIAMSTTFVKGTIFTYFAGFRKSRYLLIVYGFTLLVGFLSLLLV